MRRLLNNSQGSVLLQYCVVGPLLFLLLLAILDLSRFFAIQAILNKGAEDGLNLATKIPNFDLDLRDYRPTDPEYHWFFEARRRVLDAATRVPLATVVTDINTPSVVQLMPFRHEDTMLNLGTNPVPFIVKGAYVLRPGEKVTNDRYGQVIEHPTVKPDASGDPPPIKTEEALKYAPIEVMVEAEIQMFIPFLGNRTVRGRALGFREPHIPYSELPPITGETPPGYTITSASTTTTTLVTPLAPGTTTTTLCVPSWSDATVVSGGDVMSWCPDPASGPGPCTGTKPCKDFGVPFGE